MFAKTIARTFINAITGPVSAGVFISAALAEPSNASILRMMSECLREPANRTSGVSAAWDKAAYKYSAAEIDPASRLNGIGAQGIVLLDVPVKTATSDWQMGEYAFNLEENKGIVSIYPRYSSTERIANYERWSCAFRGGSRVIGPTDQSEGASRQDPGSSAANSNGIPMMPPGATEGPH